jgi:hypothetical protein
LHAAGEIVFVGISYRIIPSYDIHRIGAIGVGLTAGYRLGR